MKNFATYLAESEKTFDYRIKFVGDLPENFLKDFKEQIKKFDPKTVGEVKTTPVLSQPQGFENYPNERVTMMDVVFRYPANRQQVAQMVELLGMCEDRMQINELHWQEGMDTEILGIEEQGSPLLLTDYPADTKLHRNLKKDYSAVGKEHEVVKNSAAAAEWTVAGGPTPAAETTNDLPMGVKSPMTTIKRPPRPATGFRK
jgi:hypothetical protein